MIANTSSGRRFASLADYLVHGRSGIETERVAWTASRNLGTDDPELAAALMQATARQSVAVQVPVYHLTISFDPQDQVTPEQIRSVADHLLHDLGLSEHQALMVAHKDRAHAHVHVMVNRIHPETGVAWERWRDRPVIERALRAEERALGLREVPGRLAEAEGRDATRDPARTPWESTRQERNHDRAFQDRVRVLLPELRAARSWEDFQAQLAAHGLRAEGKGQGLVITDGDHEVKASRVGRDLSLRRLEERFGTPYPYREQLSGSHLRREAELSPAAREVAVGTREYQRVDTLIRHEYRAELDLSQLRAHRLRFESAAQAIPAAREALDRCLAEAYSDPETARQLIHAIAETRGADRVAALLREEPERFGALRAVDRPRAFGLLTVDDDSAARMSARSAAMRWRTLADQEAAAAEYANAYIRGAEKQMRERFAQVYRSPAAAVAAFEVAVANAGAEGALRTLAQSPDRLGSLRAPGKPTPIAQLDWADLGERARRVIEARAITSSELARAHADHAIARAESRVRELRHAIDGAPSRDMLRYGLSRAVDRLEPRELASLRRVLTSPQAALVFKARAAVCDVVLGRDKLER